jgi:hypothetical protein
LNGRINEVFDKIYRFLDNKEYVLGINNDDNLLIYHFQSNPKLFNFAWNYVATKDKIYQAIKQHPLEQETDDFITEYLKDISEFIDAVDEIEQAIKAENKKYIELYRIFEPQAYIYPFTVRMKMLDVLDNNIDDLICINFWNKARRRQSMMKYLDDIIDAPDTNGRKNSKKQIIEKIKDDSSYVPISLEEIAKNDWAAKYILWCYSKEKCEQYISYSKYKELQIEHICPQNPPSIKALGWGVGEQYEKDIESVGNKLLLEAKINNKVSNHLPSDKTVEYHKSKYKMNHIVFAKPKPYVVSREKELTKFIKEYLGK